MEVKLIVASGKSTGREIPVPGPKFLIGRAEDCHLRPLSDQVSRHHCEILIKEGLVTVRDFGSKNGTLVNGQPVKTEQELKTGDHLKVGPLDFEVRVGIPVGGKKKPRVKSIQEAAARTVESAGAAAADEDQDVADWLSEGEEASAADTHTLGAAQTERVEADPFSGLIPEEPASDAPEGEGQEEKSPEHSGKFQPPKKPVADNSRDAAADMLREFFKRK